MIISKKDLLARYVLAALAFGLFSLSFVTSSHLTPNSQRQWITLDRQVRRVLLRAERENLKSSTASDEEASLSNSPQEFGAIPQFLNIVLTYANVVPALPSRVGHEHFFLESSPVLNL